MTRPSAGDVITPGVPDPVELTLIVEELAAHRTQLAELRAALDTDGDGQLDAAAAPWLRAAVVVALAGAAIGGYALTPAQVRDPQDLLIYLAVLAALGVGEAALLARAIDRRGGQ